MGRCSAVRGEHTSSRLLAGAPHRWQYLCFRVCTQQHLQQEKVFMLTHIRLPSEVPAAASGAKVVIRTPLESRTVYFLFRGELVSFRVGCGLLILVAISSVEAELYSFHVEELLCFVNLLRERFGEWGHHATKLITLCRRAGGDKKDFCIQEVWEHCIIVVKIPNSRSVKVGWPE